MKQRMRVLAKNVIMSKMLRVANIEGLDKAMRTSIFLNHQNPTSLSQSIAFPLIYCSLKSAIQPGPASLSG